MNWVHILMASYKLQKWTGSTFCRHMLQKVDLATKNGLGPLFAGIHKLQKVDLAAKKKDWVHFFSMGPVFAALSLQKGDPRTNICRKKWTPGPFLGRITFVLTGFRW